MSTKYKSSTFITVPNKEQLRGLDTKAQVLFMWLCVYSDEMEECFPSRTTLANACGMSVRSVAEALNTLLENKLIKKKNRFIKREKTTNLYTVLILDPRAKSALPSGKICPTPRAKSAYRTQSSSNSNYLRSNYNISYKTPAQLGMPELS